MKKNLIYWIPVYIVAVIIFYFSSLSYPLGENAEPGFSDWMLHIMEYSIFSFTVYFAFLKDDRFENKKISTLIFILLFAVTDEIHQLFVPGRVGGSLFDIGMDFIGGVFVTMISFII